MNVCTCPSKVSICFSLLCDGHQRRGINPSIDKEQREALSRFLRRPHQRFNGHMVKDKDYIVFLGQTATGRFQ